LVEEKHLFGELWDWIHAGVIKGGQTGVLREFLHHKIPNQEWDIHIKISCILFCACIALHNLVNAFVYAVDEKGDV